MFIFDMAIGGVLDGFVDWIYGQLIAFFSEFLGMINMMGAEIFDLPWVQGILEFFTNIAWALYITGLVLSLFDTVIEYQNGRGNVKDALLNSIKGFMAVSLFTIVPVELYRTSITLSTGLTTAISQSFSTPDSISVLAIGIMTSPIFGAGGIVPIVMIILIGYSVIKVFFGNLKRGGILLTMIATGSLYMMSVPRGFMDGFYQWCKQVIGLCLTAFLQTIILIAGLLTFNANMLLGVGLIISSGEVPRIAGNFGLDTSTRANIMQTFYTAQGAVNMANTVKNAVSKAPVPTPTP